MTLIVDIEDKEKFLNSLYLIEALQIGEFSLASGENSPFYLDLRFLPAIPILFDSLINKIRTEITSSLYFDLMIGIPSAGVPFATGIALRSKVPLQMMRLNQKEHGLKKIIEGPAIEGKRVLLVDDLISSGYSKEKAIKIVRENGGVVNDLLVIVDRRDNEGQSQAWEKEWNVKVHPLYSLNYADITNFLESVPK